MAQFDVYRNPNPNTNRVVPYLLDVQTDLLDRLATHVVVPLVMATELGKPAEHLNPQFEIEGRIVVLSTAEIAGIPKQSLGDLVLSLPRKRDEIITALDFLFTGI